MTGIARTRLDPEGYVTVIGERWQASALDPPIDIDEPILVVEIHGPSSSSPPKRPCVVSRQRRRLLREPGQASEWPVSSSASSSTRRPKQSGP